TLAAGERWAWMKGRTASITAGYTSSPVMSNVQNRKSTRSTILTWLRGLRTARFFGAAVTGLKVLISYFRTTLPRPLPVRRTGATAPNAADCSSTGTTIRHSRISARGEAPITPRDSTSSCLMMSLKTRRQKDWRYCMQCGVLFYENFPSVCPKGAGHLPAGFNFVLPHDVAEDAKNQKDWRYCVYCGALFWDGSSNLGLCPAAPGGGFHLNA